MTPISVSATDCAEHTHFLRLLRYVCAHNCQSPTVSTSSGSGHSSHCSPPLMGTRCACTHNYHIVGRTAIMVRTLNHQHNKKPSPFYENSRYAALRFNHSRIIACKCERASLCPCYKARMFMHAMRSSKRNANNMLTCHLWRDRSWYVAAFCHIAWKCFALEFLSIYASLS